MRHLTLQGHRIEQYDLPEFLALLTSTPRTARLGHRLTTLAVDHVRGFLTLVPKHITDLGSYGRAMLTRELGFEVTDHRYADERSDTIAFCWQWKHPKKPGLWVRVRVTDQMLCTLAGLEPDAFTDWCHAQWEIQREDEEREQMEEDAYLERAKAQRAARWDAEARQGVHA